MEAQKAPETNEKSPRQSPFERVVDFVADFFHGFDGTPEQAADFLIAAVNKAAAEKGSEVV